MLRLLPNELPFDNTSVTVPFDNAINHVWPVSLVATSVPLERATILPGLKFGETVPVGFATLRIIDPLLGMKSIEPGKAA